jgi:hypothetical protein
MAKIHDSTESHALFYRRRTAQSKRQRIHCLLDSNPDLGQLMKEIFF